MVDETPEQGTKPLIRAISSFKVLAECPIFFALLLQLNSTLVTAYFIKLVPSTMQALTIQVSPAFRADRNQYADFITTQVKVRTTRPIAI